MTSFTGVGYVSNNTAESTGYYDDVDILSAYVVIGVIRMPLHAVDGGITVPLCESQLPYSRERLNGPFGKAMG